MSLDPSIHERATYWATDTAFDDETRGEIAGLLEAKKDTELVDRFYRNLEFGTGGMRGVIGAGTARMNIYNIRKATAAFAQYLKKTFPDQTLKIAVSYDSRHYSREFSETVCSVMAGYGVESYITKELRPTPMLSFLVRHFACHGGVCVTASHNPPDYNGYKVYWQTGGQITPPHDQAIIAGYEGISDYGSIASVDYATGVKDGLIHEVGTEFDELYFARVADLQLTKGGREDFKVVLTSLHGTADYPVTTMLKRIGFKDVISVPEQKDPNGNFPTVDFPNPEDPAALTMALELAKKEEADLVLATDPDCDRIGIIVREKGEYVFLNGNQIGCLLTEFVLSQLKVQGKLPENPLVIKTIVTTDLQNKIAEHYGAFVEETLTGFKWICDVIEQYEKGERKPYRQFVCGGEESYGFLADSFVRDKDAVIACCLAAEMVAHHKQAGRTMTDVLDTIYRRHGVYHESLHTVTKPGKEGSELISGMMQSLRTAPPTEIDGVAVEKIWDIKTGQEFTNTGGKFQESAKLSLPRSNVLQFMLADGSKVSARPSGTEPKIKFYVSVREAVDSQVSQDDLERAKTDCQARVGRLEKAIVARCSS